MTVVEELMAVAAALERHRVDALIRMKAQAARPQDIADIERLTEGDR